MKIDEERLHVLTNYRRNNFNKKNITSDHNILYCNFSLSFYRQPRKIRKEFFNLKCEDGKKLFFHETNKLNNLSRYFCGPGSFPNNCQNFFKGLNQCLHKCFTKVRIRTGNSRAFGNEEIQKQLKLKLELRKFLANNACKIGQTIAQNKLNEVEAFLDEQCAQKNAEKVKAHIDCVETLEGNFSQLKYLIHQWPS